ncbi:MAG TPA: XRE family transcriptional regulator [Caulobacteraceae bacterium]|jgi:transcriptional regulator with XRE-family HTH domain
MTDRSSSGRSQAKPGAVLKSLRTQRGWTLSEVSQRTGLPVSTLSKVENDKMSLTYDKLTRISEGLEIDIAQLFGGADLGAEASSAVTGRRSVTRSGEGKAIETPTYNHLYPASDLLNKRIVPIIADIRARSTEEFGELIRHPGEEYAYVIEGEVELHTELYAPVRLKTGDSIYFDSGMGHVYVNVGKGTCRILSVCSSAESQLVAAFRGSAELSEGDQQPPAPPRRIRAARR